MFTNWKNKTTFNLKVAFILSRKNSSFLSSIDTAKFFLVMSDRMGHTVEVMQKTYMHLFSTIQDEIIDLLDNL